MRLQCFLLVVILSTYHVTGFPPNHDGGNNDMHAQADIVTTAAPTRQPESKQARFLNCSDSHRAHLNDSNKFQVFHNHVWWDQVCQTGLIWNQTLCRCEYPHGAKPIPQCPEYRPNANESTRYEQFVNGKWLVRECNLAVTGLVWNQTACRCEWGPEGETAFLNYQKTKPCDTMFNATFDNGLVDNAKSSYIELTPGAKVSLRRTSKDGQKAAFIEDGYMSVWYFAGNELSDSLRVEFSFKSEDNPTTRDKYQIILSNGCNVTALGYTTPSLAIGYRATDQSFLLAFETTNVRKAIVCTRELVHSPFDWHRVSLIYEDGTLLLRVDNQPCIISEDFTDWCMHVNEVQHIGPVQKTSCPLTIGTDPLEKETKYKGYLDDISISRYCRRFVEQIPVDVLKQHDNEDEVDDVAEQQNEMEALDNIIDVYAHRMPMKALL